MLFIPWVGYIGLVECNTRMGRSDLDVVFLAWAEEED